MSGNVGALLLYLAVCLSSHLVASQEMGAYNFIWKEVTELEDVGNGEILVIKPKIVRRGRSEAALVFNVTIKRELDDEVAVRCTVAVWGNGGWRPNFLIQHFPSWCQAMMKYCPGVFKEVAISGINGCPIPEGDYHIDLSLDKIVLNNLPSLIFGKYKADVEFLRQSPSGDEVRLGGIVGVGEIVPKKKRKG